MAAISQRNSVTQRLFWLSVLLTGLPILVAATVYIINGRVAEEQRGIRDAQLPVVFLAQELSAASASLAASGAAIAAADSPADLAILRSQARDSVASLTEASAQITAARVQLATPVPDAAALSPQIDELLHAVASRFELGSQLRRSLTQATALAQRVTQASDRRIQQLPATAANARQRFALLTIRSLGRDLELVLQPVGEATEPEILRDSLLLTLRNAIRRLTEIEAGELRSQMARDLLELSKLTSQAASAASRDVFSTRRNDLELQQQIATAREALASRLAEFNRNISQLVAEAHAGMNAAAEHAVTTIASAQRTGIWAAVLVLLFAAGFCWLFIQRNVAARFEQLIGSMDRVARGDLGPSTRNELSQLEQQEDELGRIAHAVEVFRIRSHELTVRTDELKASQQELERTNEDLQQFVYHASHDLKAPLRAISVMTTMLLEDDPKDLPAPPEHFLGLIRARAHRLARLVDDLLTFSRASKRESAATAVSVRETVAQARDLLSLSDDVSIEVEGEDQVIVPQVAFEATIRNLMQNAHKHHDTPERARISIQCSTDHEAVIVDVRDDGPGIPIEHQEKIFDVFATLKSRDAVEGSGMGLAIVRRMAESYGATIESLPMEQGACFRTRWPKSTE